MTWGKKKKKKKGTCLHILDLQWIVWKGYYCFVEATGPIDPLPKDGSKRCQYSFTHQASSVRTELCFKCSTRSWFWLWCEIVICSVHAGDLLTLMWGLSSWAGLFLWWKREMLHWLQLLCTIVKKLPDCLWCTNFTDWFQAQSGNLKQKEFSTVYMSAHI